MPAGTKIAVGLFLIAEVFPLLVGFYGEEEQDLFTYITSEDMEIFSGGCLFCRNIELPRLCLLPARSFITGRFSNSSS